MNRVSRFVLKSCFQSKAAEAKKLGAQLTSRITRENTTYTITCLKEDAVHAVNLLGGIVKGPLSADTVEEARTEVLAGRKALWDVVNEEVVMDFLYSSAYQGTAHQNTVAGEISQIKAVTANDLQAFRDKYYAGSNLVVSGAGAIDHAQVGFPFLVTRVVHELVFTNLENSVPHADSV